MKLKPLPPVNAGWKPAKYLIIKEVYNSTTKSGEVVRIETGIANTLEKAHETIQFFKSMEVKERECPIFQVSMYETRYRIFQAEWKEVME